MTAASRGPSYQKYERIMSRQAGPARWGKDYLPANIVDTRDAPRTTRPSVISAPSLGRAVHLAAKTERALALLALHCSSLWELHEQRMLQFNPGPHPMAGHPNARGLVLPGVRGTLAIAEALGQLGRHATVTAPLTHPTHPGKRFPFPYVGDILLFLMDDAGPYCVNWSIKQDPDDFFRTYYGKRSIPSEKDRQKATFRHTLEQIYYEDVEIRTLQLAPSKMDTELRINLLNLVYWWGRSPSAQRARDVSSDLASAVRDQLPSRPIQYDVTRWAAQKFSISIQDAKWVIKSAIFNRLLRVDLFHVVADNLPLVPEREDPFVRYADWFLRKSQ